MNGYFCRIWLVCIDRANLNMKEAEIGDDTQQTTQSRTCSRCLKRPLNQVSPD